MALSPPQPDGSGRVLGEFLLLDQSGYVDVGVPDQNISAL